jgi:outer membrane lipoprotein SlyB
MNHPAASPRRLHPLIATAAATIIIASLAATAAITGVFPKASSTGAQNDQAQSAQVASQQVVDSAAPAPATAIAPQQQPAATGQYGPVQQAPVQSQSSPAPSVPPADQAQYAAQPAQGPYAQHQPSYSGQQPQPYSAPQPQAQPRAAVCSSCGTVESIAAIRHQGHGTGIGAVGGAVAGGLIGNQFGAGNGRTAMTVLGAVGGGFGGNALEKHLRSTTNYQVRVRMENGRTRYFNYRQPPPFQRGQPVRIEGGTLVAR